MSRRRLAPIEMTPTWHCLGCRMTQRPWRLNRPLCVSPAAQDGTWLGIPPPGLYDSSIIVLLFCARQSLSGSARSVSLQVDDQWIFLRPACGAAVHQLGPESACRFMPPDCTLHTLPAQGLCVCVCSGDKHFVLVHTPDLYSRVGTFYLTCETTC